uniref:Ccr_02 putative toxin n=2 Tax=Crassispira cerithina TaxID=1077925 RepID=A0A098LXX1_CRACE
MAKFSMLLILAMVLMSVTETDAVPLTKRGNERLLTERQDDCPYYCDQCNACPTPCGYTCVYCAVCSSK